LRNKLITVTLISAFLLISFNVKSANFIDNQIVNPDKVWTIRFTGNVGFDDATKQGITVNDSKGTTVPVDVKLGQDNKTVRVIAPTGGYTAGESYILKVGSETHSSKGKALKNEYNVNFSIKNLINNTDYSIFDQAYIKDGRLVANANLIGVNAKYTGINLGTGNVPTSMKCKAIFNSTSTLALISNYNGLNKVSDITNGSLHIVFTNKNIQLGLFDNKTLNVIYMHTFVTPCSLDGVTEYTFEWSVSGDTITFTLPDGIFTYTDNRIPTYLGQYCTFEHYWNSTTQEPPIFTYFEVKGTDFTLIDSFKRQNGTIGIAPTGQAYVQINEQNQ